MGGSASVCTDGHGRSHKIPSSVSSFGAVLRECRDNTNAEYAISDAKRQQRKANSGLSYSGSRAKLTSGRPPPKEAAKKNYRIKKCVKSLHPQSPLKATECVICFGGLVLVEIRPCGHRVACLECSAKMRSCPVCRGSVAARLLVPELAKRDVCRDGSDVAFVEYLGLDPVSEDDVLWIADELVQAPLPSPWSIYADEINRKFYYNAETHVSSWVHPLEPEYRKFLLTISDFRNREVSPAQRAEKLRRLQEECDEMERRCFGAIENWSKHHDVDGRAFYRNSKDQCSTWIDPRPALFHLLSSKMKLVCFLSRDADGHCEICSSEGEDLF